MGNLIRKPTLVTQIEKLTAENRELGAKLKQQYKRAKAAEDWGKEWQAEANILECLMNETKLQLETALAARDSTQDHKRRLFVMLENALELATKTA